MAGACYLTPAAFTYNTPNTFVKSTAISPLSPASMPAGIAGTFITDNSGPVGIATGATGNVYIAEQASSSIKKLSPAGVQLATLGSGFVAAYDVTLDGAGNIYVADQGLNVVKKIAPDGTTMTSIGTGWNGPHDVAADNAGNVYVVEFGAYLKKINPDGTVNTTFYRESSGSTASVAVDAAGNVYIITSRNVIKKLSSSGAVLATIGTVPGAPGSMQFGGIAVDGGGNVYVSALLPATSTKLVYKVDALDGSVSTFYTGSNYLYGIDAANAAAIYVCADTKIIKLSAGGGPVSSYTINPALPTGLSINAATGVISGTPALASPR